MSKKSKLEKDFTETAKQINDKIKEAAKAMKEANALAKKAGLSRMTHDPYGYEEPQEDLDKLEELISMVDIYPLFTELDKAGWRTSSIGC